MGKEREQFWFDFYFVDRFPVMVIFVVHHGPPPHPPPEKK